MKSFPKARQEKLIVRELADELLIYDKERQEARCLNRTAALIWKACDGETSIREISDRLGRQVGGEGDTPLDERVIWYGISQLRRDHLLEDEVEIPKGVLASFDGHLNRRQVIRTLGITAIVALPLVTSIVAPSAAQAATCTPQGGVCTSSAQCCSGLCNNGTCT